MELAVHNQRKSTLAEARAMGEQAGSDPRGLGSREGVGCGPCLGSFDRLAFHPI